MTVSDDAVVKQLITPLRRYIPVNWFDWEPFGKRPKSWWPDLVLILAFIAIAALLTFPSPLVHMDWEIREWVWRHKVEWVRDVSRLATELGQARTVATITLALAVWSALRFRSIRPLLMYVLSFITLVVILVVKHILGRPLSQHLWQLHEVSPDGAMLFTYFEQGGGGNIEGATAFPSGHAVNTALLFGLIVMLVGGLLPVWARWTLLLAPPVLVFASQVYIGQHWFWDEPAGLLLGLFIIRSAKRVPWATIPLGPLEVFEPATRKTILIATLLILGVMVTPAMPLVPALASAVLLAGLSLLWLWLKLREAKRSETAQVPSQPSDSSQ
ncbi:phosphatase PAP2 family protein [Glycomyces arizonensis]|uniref:phosphatase PAP2 family protein n=1 Tax=Glycomyces arizonensis TaxID=256035 RepID=UPI000402DDEE|nr:phosphatase PAP2 family protein [Glycomyces arizonensis]